MSADYDVNEFTDGFQQAAAGKNRVAHYHTRRWNEGWEAGDRYRKRYMDKDR